MSVPDFILILSTYILHAILLNQIKNVLLQIKIDKQTSSIINQVINIYVVDSRPNGWIDWAKICCWVAGGGGGKG